MANTIPSESRSFNPDLSEARRFLDALAPQELFTFQTFDDSEAKRPKLAKIVHGRLDDVAQLLTRMNQQGGGVFVTVNRTDLKGRKTANIVAVRAVFVDLDGAPLDPVTACQLKPHIVVETSPGRFHAYWIVSDCPLDRFKPVQTAISQRFNGDPSINNVDRVMRLPGFWHHKRVPFQTRILTIGGDNVAV